MEGVGGAGGAGPPTSCGPVGLWGWVAPWEAAGARRAWAGGVPPSHEGWAEAWLSAAWRFLLGVP